MEIIQQLIPVIEHAGAMLVRYRNDGFVTKTKSHENDFVTTADIETDKFLRTEIGRLFPDDKILSEEDDTVVEEYIGRVWMIDPLDGTRAFVDGSDSFSVMIGLAVDGVPELGIMYAPLRDELYYAEKGKGAFLRKAGLDTRIHVSNISDITNARAVDYRRLKEPRELDVAVDQLGLSFIATEGTNTLKIGKVAQGIADVVVNTNTDVSKWDFCAPQIVLEEAGGKVTDIKGNPIDYLSSGTALNKSFVATNGILHEAIINALQKQIKG
ncbi:MAG: inositol monophosphatase [Candidatus Andersenbacteria bacterium]